jgi:MAF protein
MAQKLLNIEPGTSPRVATAGRRLALASASPRRAEILTLLGFEFDVLPSAVDEGGIPGETPSQLALRLAEAKARDTAATVPGSAVIAADTVVELDGVSLGKPECAEHAVSILESLSGRAHTVYTAVAIAVDGEIFSGTEATTVRFRRLSPAEIGLYVRSGAGMDKAGAYGIQDEPFSPVESLDGPYSNVVGLPVALLSRLLLDAGVINAAAARDIAGRERS